MNTGIQLPVASEEEQNLESLLNDTQTRLFELRRRKAEQTDATNRAAQLERLKNALAENEQEALTIENTTIPAAYEAIKTEVAERYALCHGRTGLYNQPEKSAPREYGLHQAGGTA